MNAEERAIRDVLETRVRMHAIGNSKRKMRDVAVDLVNASNMYWEDIADGCFLSTSTIANLAKDKTMNPQTETIERVFRFFNMRVSFDGSTSITSAYRNEPKVKRGR